MAISDTSPEIEEMQLEIRRSMSGEQRLRVCLEMSVFARELRKTGIRRDHPDWSDKEVIMELFRLAFSPQPLPAWVR
jgi:hypothetical protein